MQSSKNFTGLIEKDIRVVLYDWFDDAIQLFCLKVSIQKNYINSRINLVKDFIYIKINLCYNL